MTTDLNKIPIPHFTCGSYKTRKRRHKWAETVRNTS